MLSSLTYQRHLIPLSLHLKNAKVWYQGNCYTSHTRVYKFADDTVIFVAWSQRDNIESKVTKYKMFLTIIYNYYNYFSILAPYSLRSTFMFSFNINFVLLSNFANREIGWIYFVMLTPCIVFQTADFKIDIYCGSYLILL